MWNAAFLIHVFFDVISDFPEAGEKHFWSKEGVARFKLLDDGSGCDGIITITYQCDKKWNT